MKTPMMKQHIALFVGILVVVASAPARGQDARRKKRQGIEPTDAWFLVSEGDRPVFIDRIGKVVMRRHCKWAGSFSNGLAPARKAKGKWGYIDRFGKFAIPPKFESAESFSEGRAEVTINRKRGFIACPQALILENIGRLVRSAQRRRNRPPELSTDAPSECQGRDSRSVMLRHRSDDSSGVCWPLDRS